MTDSVVRHAQGRKNIAPAEKRMSEKHTGDKLRSEGWKQSLHKE
jgi:hypothetical protein